MSNKAGMKKIGRRKFIGTLSGAAALAGITSSFEYAKAAGATVKDMTITNIYQTRLLNSGGRGGRGRPWAGIILRIETNKGIVGYGECRDLDRGAQALLNTLAPHLVGKNPTDIEAIFNTMLENYTPPPMNEMRDQEIRGTGAISGIEMACWDIMGKAQNVPIYKLLGEKLYDRIPMYGDTDSNSEEDVVSRVKKGFRHYKCDMYLSNIARGNYTTSDTPNNFGYREITVNQAGLDQMHEYMAKYREVLESFGEPFASAPIGSDHYQGYNATNQLSIESAVALAETLNEDHNPNGYVEDIVDWWCDDCSGRPSKAVADATDMRVQTGEDMFSFEQFKPWADTRALDNFHPEPNTFGGINQTLIAAKYAAEKGINNYYHNSSGPIAMAGYLHLAAVSPNFIALEYHQMDVPWHDDVLDGLDRPWILNGTVAIPEGPGIGVTINEEQFAAHGASEWTKLI
ncbi:mandelate racemase/muconate lactonizing enzyme family protein [Candidatus Latescibacterota bacterium]